jgi:hypothetical protein
MLASTSFHPSFQDRSKLGIFRRLEQSPSQSPLQSPTLVKC